MRCVHCKSDEFNGVHKLVRENRTLILCSSCLGQAALFKGTQDDVARVLRADLGRELWQEGEVAYLLRKDAAAKATNARDPPPK